MKKETSTADIFERLRNGETIPSDDPQAYKLREASFETKKILLQMNNSSEINNKKLKLLYSGKESINIPPFPEYKKQAFSTPA